MPLWCGGTSVMSSPSRRTVPRLGVLETGDDPKRRCLAAPRRPKQGYELAFVDDEVEIADGIHLAISLDQAIQLQVTHTVPPTDACFDASSPLTSRPAPRRVPQVATHKITSEVTHATVKLITEYAEAILPSRRV